jgi:hypothetical protein
VRTSILTVVLVLAACSSSSLPNGSDGGNGNGNGNGMGGADMTVPPADMAAPPADMVVSPPAPGACQPNCSRCGAALCCGNGCCNVGEQCIDGVCYCGSGAACGAHMFCAVAGPMQPGQCGTVCCGATGVNCPR